jgi:hypothetical protein
MERPARTEGRAAQAITARRGLIRHLTPALSPIEAERVGDARAITARRGLRALPKRFGTRSSTFRPRKTKTKKEQTKQTEQQNYENQN